MDSKPKANKRPASVHLTDRLPRPLLLALAVVLLFHFSLLLFGSFRATYDAYVHLFFADHYQRGWFSTWEPRWYTGFTTVSYPPGTHQILASIGWVVGLQNAFIVAGTAAVTGIVIGTYRSAQIWTDRDSAAYAAVLAALSSSIAEALHTFGQLPTLVSIAFALNGLPYVARWVRDGRRIDLAAAWSFAAATTAAHHVTTLFGVVFIVSPVVARPLLDALSTPAPDESPGAHFSIRAPLAYLSMRTRRVLPALTRAAIYMFGVLAILITVVLPYWLYSRRDPISQIPIPHGSRENFIQNPNIGLIFFVIPWGILILTLPYALVRGLSSKAWPLAASVGLLSLLGTGGTTPIPRMLLGGAFEILTLDRFTFWATLLILPLSGQFVKSLLHGRSRWLLDRNLGARTTAAINVVAALSLAGFAIFAASLGQLRPMQPDPVDMDPIVNFIDQDGHEQWRYLTLGFGDQMAWLSAQTTAETVDGNYHSARRLPELTSRPVERLEGAKYTGVAGLGSLQQFLTTPEKFHLKFIFSNDKFYDPLLWASGWQQLEPLQNGIRVWQRDDVTPLPADRVSNELPSWQRVLWGTLPPVSLLAGLAAGPVAYAFSRRRTIRLVKRQSRIDRMLQRHAAKLPPSEPTRFWYRLRSANRQAYRRISKPVGRRRMRAQRGLLLAVSVGAVAVTTASLLRPEHRTPSDVVYDYYDALDLREVERAFKMLDPDSIKSEDQYLAEYRRTSGLVSSFARLESMAPPVVAIDGDRAVVTTQLHYLTPLLRYDVDVTEQLRRVDDEWRLVYRPVNFTVAPEPFTQSPAVDYLSQGRRQPLDGPTASQDVLDRPVLAPSQANLVIVDGDLSVVGEVTNDDSTPAYLTVTAELFDADGRRLAVGSNGLGTQFTLLPGETGPYRVDFEGVAGIDGSTNLTFEPGERTDSGVDAADVARVIVNLQSLVTGGDLARNAEFVDVRRTGDGLELALFNSGTNEITVAEMFATLRHRGQPVWIVNAYSPKAVAPRRSEPQRIELPSPGDVTPVSVPIQMIVNSVPADEYTSVDNTDWPTTWGDIGLGAITFFRSVG